MKCIGFARRRYGRGGRVIVDRIRTDMDDVWSSLDFKIISNETNEIEPPLIKAECPEIPITEIVNDLDASVVVKQEKVDYNEHRFNNRNDKLDDFEQLLDSANASFNIDKSLGAISSNLSAKMPSFIEKSNPNCIEATLSNVTIKTEPNTEMVNETASMDTLLQTDAQNSLNSWNSTDHNIYQNLLDEIKSDWLHFRPTTPVPSPTRSLVTDDTDAVFDTDFELKILDTNEDKDDVTKPFKPFFHFRLCS